MYFNLDIGTLLLCNPSVNLRCLVPKDVLEINTATRGYDLKGMILYKSSTGNGSSRFNYVSLLRFSLGPNEPEVDLFVRASMCFIFDRHDLTKLRSIMRRSLRLATCRAYSLQALNWLMRTTTQMVGLHDLMWWFVAALNDTEMSPHRTSGGKENGCGEKEQAMDHPITGTKFSGHISLMVSRSLHAFLQTVADLTLLLPAGSPVQQIAVQCFGMQFRQSDHQFLHRSHVFGNISKILSRSDEQQQQYGEIEAGEQQQQPLERHSQQPLERNSVVGVEQLTDLQGLFEVNVSSRTAMALVLLDNSTETFWESDEEDRNKSKYIEVSMLRLNCVCKTISLHVDNSRDITSRVQTVIFYSGQSLGDMDLIKTVDLDESQQAGGWITALVKDETATHFRVVLNGEDPTLRVRNIKLLGHLQQPEKRGMKSMNYLQIQQRNCEAATLKVFRLLTGQVFGKLILGRRDTVSPLERQEGGEGLVGKGSVDRQAAGGSNENSILADSLDMREHMVGILFSRSKLTLTHLQKQVIVHIVHAIRKEAYRAKADWNAQSAVIDGDGETELETDRKSDEVSRGTDTYCFEMLSMVLALSGSSVGRSYLSQQYGLLKDLLALLHVGSDRVQRQVTALLRRMLPEISPANFAELLHVRRTPPLDFGVASHAEGKQLDVETEGIIDIFLAVIAKALTLQIKVKGEGGVILNKNLTTVRMEQCIQGESRERREKQHEVDDTDAMEDFTVIKNGENVMKEAERSRWFLRGQISSKQAENLITLLRDLSMVS